MLEHLQAKAESGDDLLYPSRPILHPKKRVKVKGTGIAADNKVAFKSDAVARTSITGAKGDCEFKQRTVQTRK